MPEEHDEEVPGDMADGERRSGHDRRRHAFLPELTERHRSWLTSGAIVAGTWMVAMWYHDVVGMPSEMNEFQSAIQAEVQLLSTKTDTMSNKVGRVDAKVTDLGTEVRIMKETGVGASEVQSLASSVNGLKVAVEGLSQIVSGLDRRVGRLEDNQEEQR